MKQAEGRAGLQARVEAAPENPSAVGTADPRLSCAAPTGLGVQEKCWTRASRPALPEQCKLRHDPAVAQTQKRGEFSLSPTCDRGDINSCDSLTDGLVARHARTRHGREIGRASCRERG